MSIRERAEVDQQILARLEGRAVEVFGKKLSMEELRANYHSAIKDADKYGSQLLKIKMNKSGRGVVRVWNEAGIMRPMPATRQDCTGQVLPLIHIRRCRRIERCGSVFSPQHLK